MNVMAEEAFVKCELIKPASAMKILHRRILFFCGIYDDVILNLIEICSNSCRYNLSLNRIVRVKAGPTLRCDRL